MTSSTKRWQLNPVCRLHWRQWDQDYLLFNAASGQTHMLNELGAAILLLLEKNMLNNQELIEQLVVHYDGLIADSKLQEAVDNLLITLDSLGLVELAS